jgi:hypothetical protein
MYRIVYKKRLNDNIFLLQIDLQQKSPAIFTKTATYYNKRSCVSSNKKDVKNILFCYILIDNKSYPLYQQKYTSNYNKNHIFTTTKHRR